MGINYALIDGSGNVTGIIIADDTYEPPEGFTIEPVGSSGAQIGWTYSNGAFTAPEPSAPPEPTPTQAADAALAAGITIQSASNSALNSVYSINMYAQANITAEISSILLNGEFTNGESALPYIDANGAPRNFSITEFKTFATAYAAYTTALTQYALSNGAMGSIPATPVQIA